MLLRKHGIKYIVYFIVLMVTFSLILKFLGNGFKQFSYTGPLSWKEVLHYLPEYLVISGGVVLYIIYADYYNSKHNDKNKKNS